MSLDDAFFLLLLQEEEEEERHVPMRSFLTLQEKRNRSGKIRRGSLMTPMNSPFMHLYNARQDDALITMTGFNFAALCVRLFNCRAAVVGQNQIRSTFMRHLDANANTYIS